MDTDAVHFRERQRQMQGKERNLSLGTPRTVHRKRNALSRRLQGHRQRWAAMLQFRKTGHFSRYCRLPRAQKSLRPMGDGDDQYYEEYDDAYDVDGYVWDYGGESYGYDRSNGYGERYEYTVWTETGANSAPSAGSATVNPLAAAQELVAQGATVGTHYPPAAPTALSAGTTSKPNTVATFATAKTGLSDNPIIMPVLTTYGGEHLSAEEELLASGAERHLCFQDYAVSARTIATTSGASSNGRHRRPYERLRLHIRPLHLSLGTLHGCALPCFRHSLSSGQRRRISFQR